MLQVTHAATLLLKRVRTEIGAPEDAAVRVTRAKPEPAEEAIRLEFAEEPAQDDEVVETRGLRIFVEGARRLSRARFSMPA